MSGLDCRILDCPTTVRSLGDGRAADTVAMEAAKDALSPAWEPRALMLAACNRLLFRWLSEMETELLGGVEAGLGSSSARG